jgi:CRP-like cAMP-binding protein
MDSRELLRYPYFAGLPQSALAQLSWISSIRPFKAGERLIEEGAPATHLLVVKSGEVDVVYKMGDGREVTAESVLAGDVIGWSALLEPFSLTATLVGRKDGELIALEGKKLRELCEMDTWLGYQLMIEIAKGLRDRLKGLRVQLAATM